MLERVVLPTLAACVTVSRTLRLPVNLFQQKVAAQTPTSTEWFAPIGRRRVFRLGRAAPLTFGTTVFKAPGKMALTHQTKRRVNSAALEADQTLRSATNSFQRALDPREVFAPTGRRRVSRLKRAVLLVLGGLFLTRRFGEIWVPAWSQTTSETGQIVLGTFTT